MRCRDVERWVTAYLEGDLDDHRSSALRGHARACPRCEALVADHVRLVESAFEVEIPDVPPDLWRDIESALDRAEEEDAGRSRLWLWWPRLRPVLAGAAVVGAAAVLVLVLSRSDDAPSDSGRVSLVSQSPTVMQSSRTHARQVRNEVERADQRYQETIRDLRELAGEAMVAASPEARRRFDDTMQALELRAAQERTEIGGETPDDSRQRDALYANYRAQIDFLTLAATGDVPEIPLP